MLVYAPSSVRKHTKSSAAAGAAGAAFGAGPVFVADANADVGADSDSGAAIRSYASGSSRSPA